MEGMVPEKLLVLRSRICKLLRSPISGDNWPETLERVKLREETLLESSQVMPNQLHGVASGDEFSFFHVEVTSFGTFSRFLRSESRVSPSEFRQETETMWVVETKRMKRKRLSNDPRFFFISRFKNQESCRREAKIKIEKFEAKERERKGERMYN